MRETTLYLTAFAFFLVVTVSLALHIESRTEERLREADLITAEVDQ